MTHPDTLETKADALLDTLCLRYLQLHLAAADGLIAASADYEDQFHALRVDVRRLVIQALQAQPPPR